MDLILTFLKAYWKEVVVGIVVIAAAGYIEVLRMDNVTKDGQIATLTANNGILTDNNLTLKSAIDTTNTALGKFDGFADETKKNFAVLGQHVAAGSTQLATQLLSIQKEQKPTTCPDSIKYLIDARTGYTQ